MQKTEKDVLGLSPPPDKELRLRETPLVWLS